jgi:hypothetical protein
VASLGSDVERYRAAFDDYTDQHGEFPDEHQLATWLFEEHGITGRTGAMLGPGYLRLYLPGFKSSWHVDQAVPVDVPQ